MPALPVSHRPYRPQLVFVYRAGAILLRPLAKFHGPGHATAAVPFFDWTCTNRDARGEFIRNSAGDIIHAVMQVGPLAHYGAEPIPPERYTRTADDLEPDHAR